MSRQNKHEMHQDFYKDVGEVGATSHQRGRRKGMCGLWLKNKVDLFLG